MSRKKIELRVEKTAFGGEGLAHHEGRACFVEGALPGERVEAEVLSEKKNFLKTRVVRVLEPSPHRETPPCRYAGHCGGCQYQHVSYAKELDFKLEQVRETLERAAGISRSLVSPITASDRPYGTRNSVTLQIGGSPSKPRFGFFGMDNVSVIPIESCLLADERLAGIFTAVPSKKAQKTTFRLDADGRLVSDATAVFLRLKIGGETLIASSRGFFQNNLFIAARVAEWVKGLVGERRPDVFFDLYAGVGTFAFLSARGTPHIVCIEEAGENLDALRMNCQEKGAREIEIAEGRVEKVFGTVLNRFAGKKTFIFLDPPRQGLEPSLARFLADAAADAIVYLSCDLASLGRDLKVILASGRYEMAQIRPFDMFPRTRHIEVAAFLTRRS